MNILCIDPSLTATGLVVFNLKTNRWMDAEVVRTKKIQNIRVFESHRIRCGKISAAVAQFTKNYKPKVALVECWKMTSQNSKSAAAMAIAWATITATLDTLAVSQIHIQPEDSKEACCGSRSAAKEDVADHLAGRWPHLARLAREASANATKGKKVSAKHAEHIYDAAALYVAAESHTQVVMLRSLCR